MDCVARMTDRLWPSWH